MNQASVVLFGGSFDPPHLGHLIIIEQAFELIPHIDAVWLLPTFKHSFAKDLTTFDTRTKMLTMLHHKLSPQVKSRTHICTIEKDYQTNGQTYQTLQLLQQEKSYLKQQGLQSSTYKHPDPSYSFLMGTDQLPHFSKWHRYRQLLKEIPFYLYPRPGYQHTATYPQMTLLSSSTQVVTNIASTLVRTRSRQSLPIDYSVPPTIAAYITKHHLYSST